MLGAWLSGTHDRIRTDLGAVCGPDTQRRVPQLSSMANNAEFLYALLPARFNGTPEMHQHCGQVVVVYVVVVVAVVVAVVVLVGLVSVVGVVVGR